MEVFRIQGPTILEGEARVQGSKNAVLPMMAASVINRGVTRLDNCPHISDVLDAMKILEVIGCKVSLKEHVLTIDSSGDINPCIPEDMMNRIRASFVFTGALLVRCGSFRVSRPGGCDIGLRPIDIHTDALRRLGARTEFTQGEIICSADRLVGCNLHLRFPSVGATENIMIAACRAQGVTRIYNAAREPEIEDLQAMLNSMGARVAGAGSGTIEIWGTDDLCSASHEVMPDRIDTATYLSAVCACGGRLVIRDAVPRHLSRYIGILKGCGACIQTLPHEITVEKRSRLRSNMMVSTAPYPGFATDMQSLLMTVFSTCNGVGIIRENIFENRFCLASLLREMGADIRIYGSSASIMGTGSLAGGNVRVCDLRSGAALAVAAMSARGTSLIGNIKYIDRGYENFENKYIPLGACIERTEEAL